MAKYKLDPVQEYPYVLIGLNTGLSYHKICWEINKMWNIDMVRVADVEVRAKSGDSTFHAVYAHENPEDGTKFRMVQNKAMGGIFLPECREADAVLVIDESRSIEYASALKRLREIPGVILAFFIETDKLKFKQNLLLIA